MRYGLSIGVIWARNSAHLAQQFVDIAMMLRNTFDELVELLYKATYLKEINSSLCIQM